MFVTNPKYKKLIILYICFLGIINAFFHLWIWSVDLKLDSHIDNAEKYEVAGIYDDPSNEIYRVSMENLISSPEKYDGKYVDVCGVINNSNNTDALFMTEFSKNNNITKDAVLLYFNDGVKAENKEQFEQTKCNYYIVTGIFDADDSGADNNYSGSIKHITRFDVNVVALEDMQKTEENGKK